MIYLWRGLTLKQFLQNEWNERSRSTPCHKQLMNILCKNTGIYIYALSCKIRFNISCGLNLISCKLISCGLNLTSYKLISCSLFQVFRYSIWYHMGEISSHLKLSLTSCINSSHGLKIWDEIELPKWFFTPWYFYCVLTHYIYSGQHNPILSVKSLKTEVFWLTLLHHRYLRINEYFNIYLNILTKGAQKSRKIHILNLNMLHLLDPRPLLYINKQIQKRILQTSDLSL